MVGPLLADASWIRQSFLVAAEDLSNVDLTNRTFTSASLKFTDTTPGGNFAINSPPQFTSTCDLRAPSRLTGSTGMGRWYSENIDDNSQVIFMRFGVPQFNSLTNFFSSFYNTNAGQLARTGRATGVFYTLGLAAGMIVQIMNWQLLAVHLLGAGLNFFANKPKSKFYYLKPTMPLYWNAVQSMVNQIAVNRGIVPRIGGDQANQVLGNQYDATGVAQALNNLLPEIFRPGGGIDVYALSTRAARLEVKQYKQIQASMDIDGFDLQTAITQIFASNLSDSPPDYLQYLNNWLTGTAQSVPSESTSAASTNSDAGTSGDSAAADSTTESLPDLGDTSNSNAGFGDFLTAEFNDGGAFIGIRVNYTGAMTESFTSTTAPSEIANKINSMSSQSRSTNFDFAGGNLVGGAIGATVGSVLTSAKDFLAGAADSLGISGLAALGGAAFVDIPNHWESSIAQLPRGNYTVHLTSPYGNPVSQLLNLYIPLCMLLAGALPLSSGKQSYTSPFLVELYDKGRCQTRLGIIDSMTVTRGTSNTGFTNEGHPLAIDINFSVLDLSSIMHMPIAQGISVAAIATGAAVGAVVGAVAGGPPGAVAGAVAGAAVGAIPGDAFDDDSVYSDYLAVLAGMSLPDQIYAWRRFKLNLTNVMTQWDSWVSADHFASFLGNTPPARLMALWYRGRSQ